MSYKLAGNIEQILSAYNIQITKEKVLLNHKKFKNMQRGHLTPNEAIKLQELWQKKTTRKQRQEWGLLGARVSATKARLTKTESQIKNILEQLEIPYQRNMTIKISDKVYFSVDFAVGNENLAVIEVTDKQSNLIVAAQALAFRSSEIKNKFPKYVFIAVVPKNIPLLGKNVLDAKCNKVFSTDEISALREYLSDHFLQRT